MKKIPTWMFILIPGGLVLFLGYWGWKTYKKSQEPDNVVTDSTQAKAGDFTVYVNRYNHRLLLLKTLLDKFQAMKDNLNGQGIDIDMTDAWRGVADQENAYATGHSKAHWGQSAHNYGVAFDCAPIVDGAFNWGVNKDTWDAIGQAGKDQGLVWGGEFKSIVDRPHFELSTWKQDVSNGDLTLYPDGPPVGEA